MHKIITILKLFCLFLCVLFFTIIIFSEMINCGCLSNPANGWVRITGTSFESKAFYFCNSGLQLNGSSERQCGSSGVWVGTPPICSV